LFSNVNLWFAKDIDNNIITIDEVDVNSNNKTKYYCPLCGSEVIPKAINSKQITAHFAHVDASKCNVESYLHFWFKHKFLESGDKFKVVSDKEREYVCKEILVEQSYTVGDRLYRPDVTIKTECGNVIYFEMKFSNEKKLKDYIDIWLELKNIVVEIDIKKLMSKDKLPTFNALFYDGKCFNVKNGEDNTYYNTIGKYKEEILNSKDNVDEKLKERLQKLDWFWRDVLRYKKGEKDIEYMVDLIDSIDEEDDKIILVKILKNKICNNIVNDYVNHKLININNYMNDIIIDDNLNYKVFTPDNIYDKLFSIYDVSLYYKNKLININLFLKDKETLIKQVKNNIDLYNLIESIINKYEYTNNIISKDNKIKLSNFYKTRDIVFTIYNNTVEYSKEYWSSNYNRKSTLNNDLQDRFYFNDYKEAYEYINVKVLEEVIKYNKKNKINDNTLHIIEYYHILLEKINNILSNSNKIKSIVLNYHENNNLNKIKSIYFNDYNNEEFLVCNKQLLNKSEIKKYSNIININKLKYGNIFIIEDDLYYDYSIVNDIRLEYKYDDYIDSNKNLYISFNIYKNKYTNLPNFNFNQLEEVMSKINKFINNKYIELSNTIIDSYFVKDSILDAELLSSLSPIISLCNNVSSSDIRIKLNVKFTNNKPWLVNNFIARLKDIGIYNIYNIF